MSTSFVDWVGIIIIGLAVGLTGWLLSVSDFFVVRSSTSIIGSGELLLFDCSNEAAAGGGFP